MTRSFRGAFEAISGEAIPQDEEDMRVNYVQYGNENDFKVFLPNLLSRNPLIGMERIQPAIYNDLLHMSQKIIINSYNKFPPNGYENMVLAVTLINLAKRWESNEERAFWNFIRIQLGFGEDKEGILFETMSNAMYKTMKSHNRFFSYDFKSRKREYYATIMAHALSTKESIFAFFDIMFEFYRHNLQGRIAKNDPAVARFTEAIRECYGNDRSLREVTLKGRPSGLGIGLVILLRKRPIFFKSFIEYILMKMHWLFVGSRLENKTYPGALLNDWFAKRGHRPGEVSRHFRERRLPVVMRHEAVCPRYFADQSGISLVIPAIRLGEESTPSRPVVRAEIYCGESLRREEIMVYGDEYSWTSEERRVSLASLSRFESGDDLKIRVKILVSGKMIYDSRTSLCREALIFAHGRSGMESAPQSVGDGSYIVFTTRDRDLSFPLAKEERDVPGSVGRAVSVLFEGRYGVMSGGRAICSDFSDPGIDVALSAAPHSGAVYVRGENEYGIYDVGMSVSAHIPGEASDRYVFVAGDKRYPFEKLDSRKTAKESEYRLDLSGIPSGVVVISIEDLEAGGAEVFRRECCVMEGLNISFDRPYYLGSSPGGIVRLESDSMKIEFPFGDEKYVWIPFGAGHIRVRVPIVEWRLDPPIEGIGMMDAGKAVRRKSIAANTMLRVLCPREIIGSIKAGGKPLPGESSGDGEFAFFLGAHVSLSGYSKDEDLEPVELILENGDENFSHALFSICLREAFWDAPKFELKDGALILRNPQSFIGADNAKLEYVFKGKAGKSFEASARETLIAKDCELSCGGYHCSVFHISDGIFSEGKKMIYSGACILGDEDVYRFDNKIIEVRKVRAGFKEFFILPIYLEDVTFSGFREEYGDGISYPIYSGTCYFLDRDDKKVYFSDAINPVRAVIINRRNISLHSKRGEKLRLIYDSRYKITDTLDGLAKVSHYSPDFYEYEVVDSN
ncbi:MAG: hypothetical protein LBT23_09175 [Synergistaceae bacterium]|nr:hypothetical protein [Synergistaceae bacterium]